LLQAVNKFFHRHSHPQNLNHRNQGRRSAEFSGRYSLISVDPAPVGVRGGLEELVDVVAVQNPAVPAGLDWKCNEEKVSAGNVEDIFFQGNIACGSGGGVALLFYE
jgi:predicted outer membrane repeat protein